MVNEHLVEVGSEVVKVRWIATPDKYEGPREFDDYAEAESFARRTLGLIDLLWTVRPPAGPEQELRSTAPEPADLVVGSFVVSSRFLLGNWVHGEAYATAAEAYQAAAIGERTFLLQELRVGPRGSEGVRVLGPSFEFTGGGGPTWLDGWGGVGDE
ncbi:hypothetical protein [Kribbella sp. NPDC023855]|uniref:hypothetical protein n=1 Tax=Kribbella sp. NPDC023855 TaxID=3154698 RepID=UPI0033E47E28